MSLFTQWQTKIDSQREEGSDEAFFNQYITSEKEAYKAILESGIAEIKGKLSELAEVYKMDTVTFMGFLDGIHSSLIDAPDLDSLDENSEIDLAINFEKLYYNMLAAKATWLYELKEWDGLLSEAKRLEIRKSFNEDHRAVSNKVGRNDPCPCGSGKKYKKCCGA